MSLPLATIGSAIVTVVTLLVLSQLLAPTEFGTLMLITGAGQFISVLIFEWLRLCVLRYGSRPNFGHLRIRELYLVVSLLVVAATIVLALLQQVGSVQLNLAETLGYALCLGLSDGTAAYLRARGLFSTASAYWTARALLGLAAGLVLGLLGADGAAASIGLGLSYLVSVVPVIAKTDLASGLLAHHVFRSAPKLFRFGAPMMVSGLMNTGIAAAARGFVAVTTGVAAAGTFALIWELSSKALGSVAAAVTSTSLRGLVVAHDEQGGGAARASAYQNYAVAVLAITLPAAAGLAAVSTELLALLLPPALRMVGGGQFPWIVAACFALVAKTFLVDSVFFAAERPFAAALASLAGILMTSLAAGAGIVIRIEPIATVGSAVTAGCLAAAITTAVLTRMRSGADQHGMVAMLRGVAGVAVATAAMALAVWVTSSSGATYAGLAVRVVLGVVIYVAAVLVLDRFAGTGVVAAVKASLQRSTSPAQADLPIGE